MSTQRLLGGSAGLKVSENSGMFDNRLPQLTMFIPKGLHPTVLKDKASVRGYILPAFDSQLSCADQAYPVSYEAYRDSAIQDETTGNDAFTPWFIPLGEVDSKGFVTRGGYYQYFGNSKSTFLSPSLAPGVDDPIRDLRISIYKMAKKGDMHLKHLVERPKYNPSNPQETALWALPAPKMGYLVNAYCTGSNQYAEDYAEMKNRILLIGTMAFNSLVEDLDSFRPGNVEPIDPNYDEFMYGDITNPTRALYFDSETINSNITYVKLNFGKYNKRTGLQCKATNLLEQDPDVLAKRYDLADPVNVVRIPTYEEVVKQLVLEDTVPYSFIAEVCSKKCDNFPEDPSIATEVSENVSTVYEAPTPQKSSTPYAPVTKPAPVVQDEDEEDEIPGVKDAPVWTPSSHTAWAPAVNSDLPLSSDELKEFQALHAMMTGPESVNLTIDKINRYSHLYAKAGDQAHKLLNN